MLLFIIIILLVFISQTLFTYWWLIVLDAFVAALFLGRKAGQSFLAGFFGVGLVWFGQAFFYNYQNEGLLLGKMAQIFSLSPLLIFVISVGIAAFLGGLGAWTGYSLRAIFKKEA